MTLLNKEQADSMSLSCMEIWGGNQPANIGVKTFGLDAWLFSQPYEGQSAGGDVHYLSSCASGNITRVLLADVSGHGSSVSSIAIQLRELMRRNINRVSHSRLVTEINDEFTHLTEVGCFATALVFSYFAPTGQLNVSNAGHPSPFVFSAARKEWQRLQTNSHEQSEPSKPFADMPFGVESETQYSDQVIALNPGDIVFCYSDALIEMELADGTQLGTDRLFNVVEELEVTSPALLISQLMSRLSDLTSLENQIARDDLTALFFRAHATKARSRIARICTAPVRLLLSKLRPASRQVESP